MLGIPAGLWGGLHRGLYEVGRVGACTGGDDNDALVLAERMGKVYHAWNMNERCTVHFTFMLACIFDRRP